MHFWEHFADNDPHSALYYEAEPFSFVPPSIRDILCVAQEL